MKNDRINNLIISSVVLTLGAIIISFYLEQRTKAAIHWVMHTHEVLYQATEFLSVVRDAEAGQRGYLISGDTSYLKPYYAAEKNLLWHFNDLRQLVSDNPKEEALLDTKVRPVMERKTMSLKKALDAKNHFGQDSAFRVIKTNEGKSAMDSLKYYMYILSERENQLLEDRRAKQDHLASLVAITRTSILTFVIIVSILALLALFRKQLANAQLVDQLKNLNADLEAKVKARTQELEEKNESTESLNEELRQNVEELSSMHESLQAQNRLTHEALAEVNDLYDYSPCGYHSSNADNIVIRMNATQLKWLGYTRDEIVGKVKFDTLLSPASIGLLGPILEEFHRTGRLDNVELELVRKDGSILPVILSSSAVFDHDGKFVMSRSVVYDQTERKKMESEVKIATEKMMHVLAEKNTFLAMASHDLKSPLNSMQGLLNLLKLGSENLTTDQKENLALVNGAAKNMRAMIDKLLDLNRIEQGKSLVQKKAIDLIEIVMKTRLDAQSLAEKKRIQVLADGIPSSVKMISDATIIHQILENLVSNAVKFSPPGKRVFIAVTTTPEAVLIEIVDEGPGIKPEEVHRVFGKFQKLSARPTGGETSTGLGLSIVKQLVGALDGKITFTSDPNVRTAFTVELPLK